MWNIFIKYPSGNIEFYDSVPDEAVADEIIRGLEEEDAILAIGGCPPSGCTYYKEKEPH